jgi:hypothetical protein
VKQLVDLSIVVVVMPDAPQTLDVVPAGSPVGGGWSLIIFSPIVVINTTSCWTLIFLDFALDFLV